jgi:tRNA pseudouridine55 synthase
MNESAPIANAPDAGTAAVPDAAQPAKKRKKRDVHGWIILDKPVGMTSTHAVSVIKRLFEAKRVGHAGTLDPLASGCLPIALGEATKTVPFVVDGRKNYSFTIRWGEERDTDDAEGRVVAASEQRPDAAAIRAQLPRFTGTIEQVPPRFSAVKIEGERAYDLARDGEIVELKPRTTGSNSAKLRMRITPRSRLNVGREPTYARSRAILAASSVYLGTFRRFAASGSAPSPKRT